ncbi:30S ribosomal protein S15 [bacterium]|nr:30S ribosomal protein S15 [bacterium]MCI0566000.1 30S ribosomal protein S15 [bacterium]
MLTKKRKSGVIAKVRRHDKDTGSPEAQIAILSEQIKSLAAHLKKHTKDNHSRKGLLSMVADRRTHLKYLKRKDEEGYKRIAKKFGLDK